MRYCNCQGENHGVEMIRESYPNPKEQRTIHKWLCCKCGYTEEYDPDKE